MKFKFNKEKWIGPAISAGVLIGGLIILLMITDIFVMPIFTRQGSETEVPNIIDLSSQAAEARLKEAKLGVVMGGEEYDPNRPKGTVIGQVPESGAKVKTGRRVTLTLSKGTASAQVPTLEGFSLREARMRLEKEGLRAGAITWFNDESRPDGVIVGSIPPSGTVMKLNAEVQLIVNRVENEMMVKVPRFVGLDLSNARQLAEENYLLIGDINYSVNENLLPETVMSQSIQSGQDVKKWSVINLTISSTE
jgi:eukaryotic-like serine/threonine-protein kinase